MHKVRFVRSFVLILAIFALCSGRSYAETPAPIDVVAFPDVSTRCVGDGDCTCGSRCVENFCIAGSVPDNCQQDSDCIACTGRVCARGRCLRPTANPTCAGQVCTGCEVCVDRVGCTAPAELTCANPAQCGPGATCTGDPGRCVRRFPEASCVNDSNCVPCSGYLCERNHCYAQQAGLCQTNANCGACAVCLPRVGCQNALSVACSIDSDCGDGLRCDPGAQTCRGPRPGDACMRSAECIGCNAGLMCIGGVCALEPVDAGLLDAGSFQMDGWDSGVVNPDGGLPRVGLGCNCRPGGRSPSSASVLLTGLGGVLLVLVSRRRHAR